MRVVVTGASGNVGTALLRRLREAGGYEVVGICRRPPPPIDPYQHAEWLALDLAETSALPALSRAMAGADAVVHTAWQIQPSWRLGVLQRANLTGLRQVLDAAVAAGVGHVVHMSSIAAYSPGPKAPAVDESWPTSGIPTLPYSRHKAAAERTLERFTNQNRQIAVTVLRPALIFQEEAAGGISRYFLSALPSPLITHAPVLPLSPGMITQVVHTSDVAAAIEGCLRARAHGAFNLAAEPAIDPPKLAQLLGRGSSPCPHQQCAAWHR